MDLPISIPLTGLAANDPIPGVYVEIDFAQGQPSGPATSYAALLIGNKLSTGDATVDTVVYGPFGDSPLPLATEDDAINRFGRGSELHRMWRRFVKKNPTTPLYAIAVTESAGAKATLVVTYTTNATANGNVRTYVGDEFVDTAITSGDTVTTIASNVAASINAMGDWGVTAANVAGVLTISAKQKGTRGNWLRGSSVITGSGVGTTSSATATAFFTSGTTADSNTAALATIAAKRFYYIISAAEDQTQLTALSVQISSQALAISGIRQTMIAASVDTEGNAQTIAIALNQARAELVWMQNADRPPAEIAADLGALYALGETPDGLNAPSLHNFNFLGAGSRAVDTVWDMPAARSGTAPTRSTLSGAVNNGLSPIATDQFGKTYLVMRVTTRTLTNGVTDYRIRAPHKVRILDWYGDTVKAKLLLENSGKDIIDNPIPGQKFTSPNLVWPDSILASVNRVTQEWGDDGQFENVDAMKAKTVCIREQNPRTRASIRIPADTIFTLDQIATQILQVA